MNTKPLPVAAKGEQALEDATTLTKDIQHTQLYTESVEPKCCYVTTHNASARTTTAGDMWESQHGRDPLETLKR